MILQDALNTVSGQAAAQAQSRISNTEAKEIARLSAPEQAKLLWRVQSAVEHSVVDDAFAGQQQSTAQCCACKHDRLRFEKVIALELGLPGTSDPQQGCTLKVLNRLPCSFIWAITLLLSYLGVPMFNGIVSKDVCPLQQPITCCAEKAASYLTWLCTAISAHVLSLSYVSSVRCIPTLSTLTMRFNYAQVVKQ